MAEQVYVKGIVMQQLRKTTWANTDPVAAGQIAIKLSSDSSKVEEVRVGTAGGTWVTATPVAMTDDLGVFATKGDLSDHVQNHTDLEFTVATYKDGDVSKDYSYDAISANVPVEETLTDTLYVAHEITEAITPLSNRIKAIEDTPYATEEYADQAEADAKKYADDNFVKTSNLSTAVSGPISDALEKLNTLSVSVDGAAAQVYDPDPAVENGLEELNLVSWGTHQRDLNGKENTGVAAGLVSNHNSNTTAHTDIRNKISALEEAIGATSNIMNFRGVYATLEAANTVLTTKEYGDVIVLTNGKEYVWAKDTTATPEKGKWYELGDTSGNTAAISALSDKVDTLLIAEVYPAGDDGQPNTAGESRIDINASNISTLQTDVTTLKGAEGTAGSVKTTAKSYADAAKTAVLGTSSDAATANTVYGAKKAAAAAQSTANTATATANTAQESANAAITEIWGEVPGSFTNDKSRIDDLEDTRLTKVKAGTGISVDETTKLQPTVSLAAVSGLTASADYEFCVFKVDVYGRVIAKAPITVLDGNA